MYYQCSPSVSDDGSKLLVLTLSGGEGGSGALVVACSLLIDPALSVNVNVSLSRKEIGTIDIKGEQQLT